MPAPTLRREDTIAILANATSSLGSAMWKFAVLLASLLPNLGSRLGKILALCAAVILSLYIFVVGGWAELMVVNIQRTVIGLLIPNSTGLREF